MGVSAISGAVGRSTTLLLAALALSAAASGARAQEPLGRPLPQTTAAPPDTGLVHPTAPIDAPAAAPAAGSAAGPAAAPAAGPAAGPAPGSARPVSRADAIARFAHTLARDVAEDSVGSIAAAVVVDGDVVWEGAFGWADRDARTLATPATLYRTGSISKTITALVLLRLVEEGVVDLDDPVSAALPELRQLANLTTRTPPITWRQLASHTAGLAREPGTSHAARGPYRRWKRRLVEVIPTTGVLAPPGAEYRYSNIGYGILGLALERAAGRPFEALVRERVFEPLGMDRSFLVVPDSMRPRLAAGYVNPAPDSVDPRVPRAEHRGRGYKVPNGGVYSTAGDLARLIPALSEPPGAGGAARGRRLSERLRRRMLADQTPDGAGYGLGLQLQRIGDTALAGHSGAVAGYTAYLLFDPATATGVVLLRNYNRGATNLGRAAADLVLDLLATAPERRGLP